MIDPAHTPEKIRAAVDGRMVKAVLLTHGHDDHIRYAREFADLVTPPRVPEPGGPNALGRYFPGHHPGWADQGRGHIRGYRDHPGGPAHPGALPGLHVPELGTLFSGDTLFDGGRGATGRSYSSFETIIDSIRERLFILPGHTVVNTGHGDATTIGAETPNLEEWIKNDK